MNILPPLMWLFVAGMGGTLHCVQFLDDTLNAPLHTTHRCLYGLLMKHEVRMARYLSQFFACHTVVFYENAKKGQYLVFLIEQGSNQRTYLNVL